MTDRLPLISVIVPAYNEAALLADNVRQICHYLDGLADRYRWELLIINDGSKDATPEIAEQLAAEIPAVRALHHPTNFGLGQTLKFGFANSSGDFVVTLDVDLSYDVQHIEELIGRLRESHAKIVLASPYMPGGSIENVPWLRRTLSILGNKFLGLFSRGNFSTLTSIMRVYDGPFIRSLDMRSTGMDLMPEMLYKAMVVHAKIEEAPGRLDWGPQLEYGASRVSSLRIIRHVGSTVLSGFVFRPFLFFVVPGLVIAAFAIYVDTWMFIHYFDAIHELRESGGDYSFSDGFAAAYQQYPHTFVIAFLSSMLGIQLIGLGVLALQNMRYFEDLYHLNSAELKNLKVNEK
ncbi:MAG: glycosyltransferase family 2 protein [Gammaproteobacteria bacterium]|nr:glycosyltransferase family 2 protein [Gammaproteobacteria bacterium]